MGDETKLMVMECNGHGWEQYGEKNVGKWKEVIGEKHAWGVYHDGGDDVARHKK